MYSIGHKDYDQMTVPLPHYKLEKWHEIEKILQTFTKGKIKSYSDFEEQLLILYNIFTEKPLKKFEGLEKFFEKNLKNVKEFYSSTLPYMASLALELPKLFPNKIRILKQNLSDSISFTKKQIACLVVHMFFGTIHSDNKNEKKHGLINFQYYLTTGNKILYEKLCCLFNYFQRLANNTIDLTLNVSYIRLKSRSKRMTFWKTSNKILQEVIILDDGAIEDFTENSIQVDFANKYIGGGALLDPAVQEEIRFIICPECFPSMFIFEGFLDDEVGYIIGAEHISKYEGYGQSFEFAGDFIENEPKIDSKKRFDVNILALDALCFMGYYKKDEQLKEEIFLRELNKAFIGFNGNDELLELDIKKKTIKTGRWGCGAFNGIPQLKFILQWLAVSQCEKSMIFYRKEDKTLEYIEKIIEGLKGMTVGEIIEILLIFKRSTEKDLFNFILNDYLKE